MWRDIGILGPLRIRDAGGATVPVAALRRVLPPGVLGRSVAGYQVLLPPAAPDRQPPPVVRGVGRRSPVMGRRRGQRGPGHPRHA